MTREPNRLFTDRRSFLKRAGAVTAIATATGTFALILSDDQSGTPADNRSNSTANRANTTNHFTARSRSDLRNALARAESGDVVFITANIDTRSESFAVPARVTLAGDRGIDGSAGPVLSTESDYRAMVELGANARVTGLRFDGPIYEYIEGADTYPAGSGIQTTDTGCEVDNCEIFGFSYAGVDTDGHDCYVHHNDIHHCSRDGLGYGVVVTDGANPLIEHNYFNYNRHSVACDGDRDSGYTIRYNVFGPDIIYYTLGTHRPGGGTFEVHHNTIMGTEVLDGSRKMFGIAIRGAPVDVYDIHHNWFYHTEKPDPEKSTLYANGQAIMQYQPERKDFKNVTFSNNHYGPSEPSAGIGALRSHEDGFRTPFQF